MDKSTVFYRQEMATPLGRLFILTDDRDRLRVVEFMDVIDGMHADRLQRTLARQFGGVQHSIEEAATPSEAFGAIRAYFEGDLTAIDSLPVEPDGTPFQKRVWRALREIPCGQTISYAELAERIGNPTAVRAVGLANGSNPVGIVVPCHRVIGKNGSLTGYGGGLTRKQQLLTHEGVRLNGRLPF